MEKYRDWQHDDDYLALVGDLLAKPEVQRLADFTQHYYSNRLEHSIRVSYTSYLIAKKLHLDVRSTARPACCMTFSITTGALPSSTWGHTPTCTHALPCIMRST